MTHILSAQKIIIDRITDQVTGFTTIGNPSKIAGLRDIGPLLPGCFVMPGAGEIASQQKNGTAALEEQEWVLVIIVGHQYADASDGLTEDIAGGLMSACIKALSGYPAGAGFHGSFTLLSRPEPAYGLGYAEFPLTFSINALVAG